MVRAIAAGHLQLSGREEVFEGSGVLQLAALIMSYFEVAESRHALNGPHRRSRGGDC